ncbi:MAG: 16S rRNA (uracil(1498)-N(3))-methyltransferase [Bacteroidota bacterium]
MNIFFNENIPQNGLFEMSEEESKHCIRVLRMQTDNIIGVIDGIGHFAEAKIIEPNAKHCLLEVISFKTQERMPYSIHIAVAPTKNNDRMEWFVEKATEIGVDEISFLKCRNSERKEIKVERFNKIALAAIKQCNRLYLPIINEMQSFDSFISKNLDAQKFIAYCPVDASLLLNKSYKKSNSVVIVIGPEGDFALEEVKKAVDNNFSEISLGSYRYRTETAALAACHTIDILNQII